MLNQAALLVLVCTHPTGPAPPVWPRPPIHQLGGCRLDLCERSNRAKGLMTRLVDEGSEKSQNQISPMKTCPNGGDEILSWTKTKNKTGPTAKTNDTLRATKSLNQQDVLKSHPRCSGCGRLPQNASFCWDVFWGSVKHKVLVVVVAAISSAKN